MVKKILQVVGALIAVLFLASLVLFWFRYDVGSSSGRANVPKLETPVGPPAEAVDMVLAITDEIDSGGGERDSELLMSKVDRFYQQGHESSIAFLSSRMAKDEIRAALAPQMTALQRKQAGGVGKVGKAFEAMKAHWEDTAWRTEGEPCPNYDIKRKGFSFAGIRLPGNLRYWVPERFMRISNASGISVETEKLELPKETQEYTRVFLSMRDEALAGRIERVSTIYFIYDMNYEWRQTAFGSYQTEAWPIIRDAFIVNDGTVIWSTFGRVGEKFPPESPKPPEAASSHRPAPAAFAGSSRVAGPEASPTGASGNVERAELSRPSFDCAQASSATEILICGNPLLAKLDAVLSANYQAMSAANIGNGARDDLRKTQAAWLAGRNQCADAQCLVELYRRRIDEVCEYPVLSGMHPGCMEVAAAE